MITDPKLKRLLNNRYRLLERVGRGAMGTVYRAEDVLLGSVMAIKFLSQSLLNAKMRERFLLEAKTCAQLGQKSIHIVRVTDYGVDEEDVPYYVMEYLQGKSLSEVISAQQLPLPRFLSFARQICLGLQAAHQGILINDQLCPIIHRDIKPSNIVVSQDASLGELVKVLDFGIVKLLQTDGGQTSSYMGTLAYSSPEQMEGRDLDARSDIYSLGVMMFEMLTGKMPLQAETHSFGSWYKTHHFKPPYTFEFVNPTLKLPKALENMVMSCLEKSPAKRPQSIAHILRALQPLEERYDRNIEISQHISKALAGRMPIIEPPTQPIAVQNEFLHKISWPKSKPIAQIVFPQTLSINQETSAAVWVMLSKEEVEHFQTHKLYNKIYRNFLCTMSPHPMILWVTAVYNPLYSQQGPRWLRCYLDLKTSEGQEMTRLLAEKGVYQVLLFYLDAPMRSPHSISVALKDEQRSVLQTWVITSQAQISVGSPNISKESLQKEFDTLKSRISAEMEKNTTSSFF